MILDSGIVSVFRRSDTAAAGEMPKASYTLLFRGWYGELNFETSPQRPTEGRTELRCDARIRVIQNRNIRQDDVAVLRDIGAWTERTAADPAYKITRAYHGEDEDGAGLISDLSLEVYKP